MRRSFYTHRRGKEICSESCPRPAARVGKGSEENDKKTKKGIDSDYSFCSACRNIQFGVGSKSICENGIIFDSVSYYWI